MTVGSLFSGIGGFDLAAERVGWKIQWQVEIDPYCTKVLEKHWPHVRRYGDIKRLKYPLYVDVLCGGFPCQDISHAGKRVGITGKRSGLWAEFARLIRAVRPRYVVVENVSALLTRGLGRVLGDLAACGYDAEWDCIPASAVGAPHIRDRVWIVAYRSGYVADPKAMGRRNGRTTDIRQIDRESDAPWNGSPVLADATGGRVEGEQLSAEGRPFVVHADRRRTHVADTECQSAGRWNDWTERRQRSESEAPRLSWSRTGAPDGGWAVEPNVGRVAHGVPARVDRLRGLGNAIVPQVAEWIFRQIQAYEERQIA